MLKLHGYFDRTRCVDHSSPETKSVKLLSSVKLISKLTCACLQRNLYLHGKHTHSLLSWLRGSKWELWFQCVEWWFTRCVAESQHRTEVRRERQRMMRTRGQGEEWEKQCGTLEEMREEVKGCCALTFLQYFETENTVQSQITGA